MERKNILLIVIVVLVVAVLAVAAFSLSNPLKEVRNATDNITSNFTTSIGDMKKNVNNTNDTVVGDNSKLDNNTIHASNKTYKVYNPQSDSYVDVIGEKFDEGVNRWYTYDKDGVRYYNTRIN
ncbi:hypothetical protein [uncultured Methanobrevibacter sp.]|uniref:hypothetical protein n=1 Tax=uncultured Methanobrevibacter sp. TaxID=253161 RepID=UPI0025E99960|nr:hypothetical protein [uncultured Methanobrevibacter sp.]